MMFEFQAVEVESPSCPGSTSVIIEEIMALDKESEAILLSIRELL